MKKEKINYGGWENSLRLSNGIAELIIITDVGPRIIHYGLENGQNEFKEFEEMRGKKGSRKWRIYGGHRLWHAPERKDRTYYPDNHPIEVKEREDSISLIQPVEPATGISKEINVLLEPVSAQVRVTHILRNNGVWPVKLSPWALSVMHPGGTAIVPHAPRGEHDKELTPTHSMSLWAYTDMSDPRWRWGNKYVMLRQNAGMPAPQKIGLRAVDGWMAYWNRNRLFVKRFPFFPDAEYPDYGCSAEIFTNADMLELESLGPMTTLEPGEYLEHQEYWNLFDEVAKPETEQDVDDILLPLIQSCRQL